MMNKLFSGIKSIFTFILGLLAVVAIPVVLFKNKKHDKKLDKEIKRVKADRQALRNKSDKIDKENATIKDDIKKSELEVDRLKNKKIETKTANDAYKSIKKRIGTLMLLIVFMISSLNPQEISTPELAQDDTLYTFTAEEVKNMESVFIKCANKDSVISELDLQIKLYKRYSENDSIKFQLKESEIKVLEEHMQLYIDELAWQTRWYNHRYLWFGYGVGTIYLASIIVDNIK